MQLRGYLLFLPLFLFILWESGAIHSILELITPLYTVRLVSALLLFTFLILTDVGRFKLFLASLLFFLPIFVLNVAPYVVIVLIISYLFSKSAILFKGAMILSPLSITEGIGLTFPLPLTIFFTCMLLLLGLRMKEVPKREVKPITYIVICASLVLLLISFSPLNLFGPQKNNVVAFDAYHHRLESPFFENDTMVHSTLRYLGSIGYKPLVLNEPINASTLKTISIVIIETPEKEFTLEEIGYIVKFVKAGGGLFVLGDHTNVYDCYLTLNPLLNRFGISLNFDYSMLWEPHFPSLAGFNSFEETAGATLGINTWDGIMFYSLKYTTWADLGDWKSQQVYIGNLVPEEGEDYGVLPVCATVNYHQGRVVAIANSDSMSGSHLLYNRHFIAKIIDYLNHENGLFRSLHFRVVLLIFSMFGILRVRLFSLKPFLVSLLFALILLQIFTALPIESMPKENLLALDVGHANIEGYGPPHSYKNIFFVIFAQHYGFNPVLAANIPEDIGNYKAYVTIGPTTPFSGKERDTLRRYVEEGGVLIVFDGYHAETPMKTSNIAANSLLESFNISLYSELLGETSYFGNTTWNYEMAYRTESKIEAKPLDSELMQNVNGSITMHAAVEIHGGTPISTYDGKPVIAVKNAGRGYVLVVAEHTIFRNFVKYEPVFTYPDPNLKKFIENTLVFLGGEEQIGV
jgi:hypothetical protein